jgi:hypothetical protein
LSAYDLSVRSLQADGRTQFAPTENLVCLSDFLMPRPLPALRAAFFREGRRKILAALRAGVLRFWIPGQARNDEVFGVSPGVGLDIARRNPIFLRSVAPERLQGE